jgi:hypothetical protein
MRLARAASFFDRTTFVDAYGGGRPIRGQRDVFDDSKRDGLMNTRRVFSFAPDVAMPARGVLATSGENWILGKVNVDDFYDEPTRHKYPVQQADGLATVQTAAQALAAAGGTQMYCGAVWLKGMKDPTTDSDAWNLVSIFAHASESAMDADRYVTFNGSTYYTNLRYHSPAGFRTVEAVEFDAGYGIKQVGYVSKGVYDPVSDTMAPGGTVQLPAIVMRFQDNFVYRNGDADSYVRGDRAVVVRKLDMALPVQNESLTIDGAAWRILDFTPNDDCWLLHTRRA